ncbi:hypothetical protein Bhyg_01414 [Pseudolycoriella hygida]|uniref:Uncharacterized protein n=1 Tax=Pseudolycoriella hygida TaxID=35572 RepID=A0A9Q0N9H4_9DIPT|nr:hypothetical protein Bhyg_01414 [Pseudolycoriella hygida]
MQKHTLTLVCLIVMSAVSFADDKVKSIKIKDKDMLRKSIVYDKKTPDVFYCPTSKPTGMDKLIVRSRPLDKLCEYEGKPLPPDYKSDCYQDADESPYACKEKLRIMTRIAKERMEDE